MPSTEADRVADAPEPQAGPGSERTEARSHGWVWVLVVILAAAAVGAYLYFTHSAKPAPAAPHRAVPVVTVKSWTADIGVRLPGLGAVTPLNTVTVHTRVDGQLMEVRYKQGQLVEKDALLAMIDPRPFQAQLLQAQGQLQRDKAFLANARKDLDRYDALVKQDSIAQQQRDDQASLVQQYEGTVAMDQGQVDNAQVQLDYTRITSPLTGRVGLRLVDPGNIVHAADPNGLVVITQLQPMSVIFVVPEDNLPDVLAKFNAGVTLSTEAFDRSGNRKLAEGRLEWVDNVIDPTTGTVKLRAVFPNEKNELFPGQFVNISLLLAVEHNATLAPSAAIQRGPNGTFVYVIGADNVATVRPVRIGPTEKDNAAFEEGLKPGDEVVVEGADRLREGQKVEISGPGEGPSASMAPSQESAPSGAAAQPGAGEAPSTPATPAGNPPAQPSGEAPAKTGAGS